MDKKNKPVIVTAQGKRIYEMGWNLHSTQQKIDIFMELVEKNGQLSQSEFILLLQELKEISRVADIM